MAVVLLSMAASPVKASEMPDTYVSAMKAYQEEGSKAMLKILFSGSPIDDKKAIENIDTELKKAEGACGSYQGNAIIKKIKLTNVSMVIFSEIDYQKCPMFVYQIYYYTGQTWVITQINFDTNPMNIFPHELFVQ